MSTRSHAHQDSPGRSTAQSTACGVRSETLERRAHRFLKGDSGDPGIALPECPRAVGQVRDRAEVFEEAVT